MQALQSDLYFCSINVVKHFWTFWQISFLSSARIQATYCLREIACNSLDVNWEFDETWGSKSRLLLHVLSAFVFLIVKSSERFIS